DGHEWTMGAYATDYVEKVWPLTYRGGAKKLGKFGYPSEGQGGMIARPSGGYFFDRCAEAGLNYRSYGEFVENGPAPGKPSSTKFKNLEGHFDPLFRGYDLDYSDVKRAERFLAEIARFEREGELPRWIVLRLPNDHTSGTSPGKLTPTAMVAQNDFALGMVIEGLSKSKFWPTMAVFVVEDDAQNGPDHVDAHRTVALAVSPYSKRRSVDSSLYSTSSMLRTMGLILGTKPLSQFDAAARPMYASFQPTLDLAPYAKVAPSVDIEARNLRTAWGAQKSLQFDLSKEDQADDIAFSEVIWKSVKGANSPLPAPVRAAFFVGKPRGEDDDDD
ncbi:MAG TPA: phosphoesterase, partial [Planctomycetia bacterium]|nr:phosphoesterase [Planctomycetia bacterium]